MEQAVLLCSCKCWNECRYGIFVKFLFRLVSVLFQCLLKQPNYCSNECYGPDFIVFRYFLNKKENTCVAQPECKSVDSAADRR